jgi:hypothetical protein
MSTDQRKRTTTGRTYVRTEEAAVRLDTTAEALRARCRRNLVREGQDERAYLGDGVVGTKFGRNWRFLFPE